MLVQVYFLISYLVLIILWFLLGAIVNPNAYLPFASSSATFITAISSKFFEFKNQAVSAYEKIMKIIVGFA